MVTASDGVSAMLFITMPESCCAPETMALGNAASESSAVKARSAIVLCALRMRLIHVPRSSLALPLSRSCVAVVSGFMMLSLKRMMSLRLADSAAMAESMNAASSLPISLSLGTLACASSPEARGVAAHNVCRSVACSHGDDSTALIKEFNVAASALNPKLTRRLRCVYGCSIW